MLLSDSLERQERQPLLPSSSRSDYQPRQGQRGDLPIRENNLAVRRNLQQTLVAVLTSLQFSHIQLCSACTFLVPQLVAIIMVLTNHWKTEKCDEPLIGWSVAYGARLTVSLSIAVLPFLPSLCSRSLRRPLRMLNRISHSSGCEQLINITSFVLFILGTYWLFHSETCAETAPAVYQLVSGLLLFNAIIIFLPLMLYLLCCPLLWFCTPLLLWFVAFMVEISQERRGLSPAAIQALPSLTYPPITRSTSASNNSNNQRSTPAQTAPSVSSIPSSASSSSTAASSPSAGQASVTSSSVSGLNALLLNGPTECSICLDPFVEGQKCRMLSCNPTHIFHAACVDEWLRLNGSCPICRSVVRSAGSDDDDDDYLSADNMA